MLKVDDYFMTDDSIGFALIPRMSGDGRYLYVMLLSILSEWRETFDTGGIIDTDAGAFIKGDVCSFAASGF